MIKVRIADKQDAFYISNNMRLADQEEFYKVTGDRDALDSIVQGMDSAHSVTYCLLKDDRPFALVGCIEKEDFKIVWACGTDEVFTHGKSFVLETKKLLEKHKSKRKPYLNYVDCENKNAVRYLKHVGFEILEPIHYGKLDSWFYPFIMG